MQMEGFKSKLSCLVILKHINTEMQLFWKLKY